LAEGIFVGTYLKNMPDRDTGKYGQEQGATTLVYPPRYSEEERRGYWPYFPYPFGLRPFFEISALFVAYVSQGIHITSRALRFQKMVGNAVRAYF
jgi:hypothetical protein